MMFLMIFFFVYLESWCLTFISQCYLFIYLFMLVEDIFIISFI